MIEHQVATMDATSAWPAVTTLRAWERDRLGLHTGERLIDVGCGPGDAAFDLGPGEVIGSTPTRRCSAPRRSGRRSGRAPSVP